MLNELLGSLASEFVLADATDPESLATIRRVLDDVSECLGGVGSAEFLAGLESAHTLLGSLMSDSPADPIADMAKLGEAIDRMRRLAADGRALPEPSPDEDSGASGAELVDDGILGDFLDVQGTRLDELEQVIIDIGSCSDDDTDGADDCLGKLRGRIHTLKGEAGVLHLEDVSHLCHEVEDVLGSCPITELEDPLLAVVDWLRVRFEAEANNTTPPAPLDLRGIVAASHDDAREQREAAPASAPPAQDIAVEDDAVVPDVAADAGEGQSSDDACVANDAGAGADDAAREGTGSASEDCHEESERPVDVDEVVPVMTDHDDSKVDPEQTHDSDADIDSTAGDATELAGGDVEDASTDYERSDEDAAVATEESDSVEDSDVTEVTDTVEETDLTEADEATDASDSTDAPDSTDAAEVGDPAEDVVSSDAEDVGSSDEEVVEEAAPAVDAGPPLSIDDFQVEGHALSTDPLMGDFVSEAQEHLEDVDSQLLTLEDNPQDAEAVNSVFRAFHTIKGLSGFLDLPVIQRVAHEAETMLDKVRSGSLRLEGAPMNITFEANDCLKRMVTAVEQGMASNGMFDPDPAVPRLLMRLAAMISGRPLPDDASAKAGSSPEPEAAVAAAPAPAEATPETKRPAPAPASPKKAAAAPEGGAAANAVRETIKVDASRLDALVDMIGELVIAEAMVSESDELDLSHATKLPSLLNHMDKITRELQEMAMSLRMVPIGSTFRRMARLARDVASKLGKKVEFVTKGDETELDKTVVDAIGDPLVHMVRNAVDHGLEANAAERQQAGKPAKGLVILRAFHQGGSIHIEIEDDGRGMDRDRILAKAREKGIVGEDESLSDSEVYSLIFAPGFSTAAQVTDVSGRGVGLDVVKRNIEALRGRVEIRSVKGKGSTFSIRLPLTLAIIDGMVVRVGRERYILPTNTVVRMIRPDEQDLSSVFERNYLLKIGDDLVPMFRLAELFEVPDATDQVSRTSAVIVEHDNRRYAFLVDQLLGQQQIVIKPLGQGLSGTQGLAGGAIMPDGQVGLILDIAGLVSIAGTEMESRTNEPRRSRPVMA